MDHQALVADPLAELVRRYVRLSLALSDPARQRMRRSIGRDHHYGRLHRYALAGVGLEPAVVDRRFARYRQWVATATRS